MEKQITLQRRRFLQRKDLIGAGRVIEEAAARALIEFLEGRKDGDLECTCKYYCPYNCKGQCGCEKCKQDYEDQKREKRIGEKENE